MDEIYKTIDDYNPNKKQKILIAFGDMVSDMLSNKKPNPIVTELFIKIRKLNFSLVFITQYYFAIAKNIRLNFTHKRELQQIAFNDSSDINFQDFMDFYKKSAAKPYSFLVINATMRQIFFTFPKESFRSNTKVDQLMVRLQMENYSMMLTKKQQKYQHYLQVIFINMNILQVKKIYPLIKVE